MRAFIAIQVEPALLAELARVQRKLEPTLPVNAVRWTGADQKFGLCGLVRIVTTGAFAGIRRAVFELLVLKEIVVAIET